MKRRDFLKFGLFGFTAAAGGALFLKYYKHYTGVIKIIEHPAPILRRSSKPVAAIDDEIVLLSHRMVSSLRYHALVGFFSKAFLSRGLAAPQVGISKRLIACGIHGEIKVLINPEIIEEQGTYCGYENCLSLPGYARKIIKRPNFIRLNYQGLDNKHHDLTAAKGYAALLSHEIDHLNGNLYIDYDNACLDT